MANDQLAVNDGLGWNAIDRDALLHVRNRGRPCLRGQDRRLIRGLVRRLCSCWSGLSYWRRRGGGASGLYDGRFRQAMVVTMAGCYGRQDIAQHVLCWLF